MATLITHSKGYAFAWHVIGTSWYLPSDKVNDYLIGDTKPNYPVPATCELHMSPELMDHWPQTCNGLLGECVNCIWPNCEH